MATTTISDTSRMVVVRSDADYQIPSDLCEEVGKRVTVVAGADITVTSATGTINGDVSFALFEEESIQLVFDGTNWTVI